MQKHSGKQWCRDISEIVHTGTAVFAHQSIKPCCTSRTRHGHEVASLVQQGIRSHFQLLKLAETDLKHPPFLLVNFFFTEIG